MSPRITILTFVGSCLLHFWILPSVGLSVGLSALTKTSQISTIRLFQRWRRSVMIRRAPVEVYTALLLPLPKSTRLMTPCIRPCSISSNGISMWMTHSVTFHQFILAMCTKFLNWPGISVK